MKIVDLTHVISPDMPVYPGTEAPVFTNPCTIADNGFNEKKITMFSHTGTHIDSPSHILTNGPSLDSLPMESFCGSAAVIDASGETDGLIRLALIKDSIPAGINFALIHTGWSKKWGNPDYFLDYPVLTTEAAKYLAGLGIKGIGVDTVSVDPVGTVDFTVHKIFLGGNIIIIENLTNLASLKGQVFTFSCLPLKLPTADGSPVRAVAIYD